MLVVALVPLRRAPCAAPLLGVAAYACAAAVLCVAGLPPPLGELWMSSGWAWSPLLAVRCSVLSEAEG